MRAIVPKDRDRRSFKNGFGIRPGNGDPPLQQQVQMQAFAASGGKVMTPAQGAGMVDADSRGSTVDQGRKAVEVGGTHLYELQS